jgi:hypothetical protein
LVAFLTYGVGVSLRDMTKSAAAAHGYGPDDELLSIDGASAEHSRQGLTIPDVRTLKLSTASSSALCNRRTDLDNRLPVRAGEHRPRVGPGSAGGELPIPQLELAAPVLAQHLDGVLVQGDRAAAGGGLGVAFDDL